MDTMMRAFFTELRRTGGTARPQDILPRIEPSLRLTDYEKAHTKTGAVRWETHLRYYSTDCARAGYITKSDGAWTLTKEGVEALGLPPGELIRSARRMYRAWRRAQRTPDGEEIAPTEDVVETEAGALAYERAMEAAREGIERHVRAMGPYDFQKLAGCLLSAMGYRVRRIAEPGPDGGVDILAYLDPLGSTSPRVRVQVKHRQDRASVKEVRELGGLLRTEGDTGLFVSTGGFTSDALREANSSAKHIDTMDLARFINLWQEHYSAISQEGKQMLPLSPVYFLAPGPDSGV